MPIPLGNFEFEGQNVGSVVALNDDNFVAASNHGVHGLPLIFARLSLAPKHLPQ